MERRDRNIYKKKTRRKRIFWFVLFPILLLGSAGASYAAFLVKKAESTVNKSFEDVGKSELREAKVDPKLDNVSILFIGVDDSENRKYGESSRSDALMLATLNEKEKSVKLVSIPRDSYVYIDEVGYKTKINHAHAYGGPKATIKTVEELLDIPVDYYVRLDFYAFMEVVDALEGIEVEVPYAMKEKDSNDRNNAIQLQPGRQVLSGEEALAFARTRKMDNDIERGKRQQELMKAVLSKAASAQSVSKYGKVIDAVGANMKTNMTFSEMKSLVNYAVSDQLNMETLTLPGTDSNIDGVYYWELDEQKLAELRAKLRVHLNLSEDESSDELAAESRDGDSSNE